jgi:acyl-CoA reductase-like NAD-dependent aldehyde dehydrogenase
MGPLVSQEQLSRVTNYMHQGKQEGACYVTGGARSGDRGYFVEPTVVKDVDPKMSIVREEIFGPVVVAEPFTKAEDLITRANRTQYGLAAGVWTRDIAKAHRIAAELKAGTVWVNCYNVFTRRFPLAATSNPVGAAKWARSAQPLCPDEGSGHGVVIPDQTRVEVHSRDKRGRLCSGAF